MRWSTSNRADPAGKRIADQHYNRQTPDSAQFAPPGRCLVFVAEAGGTATALWVSTAQEYSLHAWGGAWINSTFRNEGAGLSSELITEAVAATRAAWGDPPPLGFVTFIDESQVRHKRDPGRCYRKAGWCLARCPKHLEREEGCAACRSRTVGGLLVLQLAPERFPAPELPRQGQAGLFTASGSASGVRSG